MICLVYVECVEDYDGLLVVCVLEGEWMIRMFVNVIGIWMYLFLLYFFGMEMFFGE